MYEATLVFVKAKIADSGQWDLRQHVTHDGQTAVMTLTFGHGYFTGAALKLDTFGQNGPNTIAMIDRPVEEAVRRFVEMKYPTPDEPWIADGQ